METNPISTIVGKVKLYDEGNLLELESKDISEILKFIQNPQQLKLWIITNGIHKDIILKIGKHFGIHKLFLDDIISIGQRPKLDDIDDGIIYILMPIISWDKHLIMVQKQQLSIVIGSNFIWTVQQLGDNTPLTVMDNYFRNSNHPIRTRNVDFLLYQILDTIVDDYFNTLDEIAQEIELLEEQLSTKKLTQSYLDAVAKIRKEVFIVKRLITPVRDIINSIYVKDNDLIQVRNKKYFKDVLDHITIAIEYNDNYRESTINLQDLYMNQLNTRTNEVMKTLTIVTTLLAPAMLLASIYGMNFENMPLLHSSYGFMITIGIALIMSFAMLYYFKRNRWY